MHFQLLPFQVGIDGLNFSNKTFAFNLRAKARNQIWWRLSKFYLIWISSRNTVASIAVRDVFFLLYLYIYPAIRRIYGTNVRTSLISFASWIFKTLEENSDGWLKLVGSKEEIIFLAAATALVEISGGYLNIFLDKLQRKYKHERSTFATYKEWKNGRLFCINVRACRFLNGTFAFFFSAGTVVLPGNSNNIFIICKYFSFLI